MQRKPSQDFYSWLVVQRLRSQVDRLDDRLIVLLHQRLGLARELGRLKQDIGLPLHDPDREHEVLQRLASAGSSTLKPEAIRQIFRCIIDASLASEEQDASSCE